MNSQDCIPVSVRSIFTGDIDPASDAMVLSDTGELSTESPLDPGLRFLLEAFINGLETIREEISVTHPQLWEPLDRKQQLLDHMQAVLNSS